MPETYDEDDNLVESYSATLKALVKIRKEVQHLEGCIDTYQAKVREAQRKLNTLENEYTTLKRFFDRCLQRLDDPVAKLLEKDD